MLSCVTIDAEDVAIDAEVVVGDADAVTIDVDAVAADAGDVAKGAGRHLVSVATLPPDFVELAAFAVTNHTALARPASLPPAEMRDLMQFAAAFDAVADEFEMMCRFIRHSAAAARPKAGHEALTVYLLIQRLAKRPETADLAPIAETMRRALGKRIRKGKGRG